MKTLDSMTFAGMTGFSRALYILNEHRISGLHPDAFYKEMWPEPVNSPVNSAKGGPSGQQCAANWLLGRVARKYPGSVERFSNLDRDRLRAGRWFITSEGVRVFSRLADAHVSRKRVASAEKERG